VSKLNLVKFAHHNGEGFYDTLKKNIDQFFKENNISQKGNSALRWKTVAMLALFFVPNILIITGVGAASPFLFFGLWFLMGMGMIGIGCSVHHDSNHGRRIRCDLEDTTQCTPPYIYQYRRTG
jgi:linoleoyl-CoA desaturase